MSATSDGRNPQPNFSRNRNNRVPALSAGYHISLVLALGIYNLLFNFT